MCRRTKRCFPHKYLGSYIAQDGKSDPSRFNIDLGDRVYKMRASSIEEGEKYVKSKLVLKRVLTTIDGFPA